MHNYLDEECVLPIIEKEKRAVGSSAVIYKISLLPEYNELEPPIDADEEPRSESNTFIMKSYRTRNAEKYYNAEKKAYMRLQNGKEPPQNILGYYGSFIQGKQHNALLEYMDRGTLEGYMQDVLPPSIANNIVTFWESIFGLILGLTLLHGCQWKVIRWA